MTDTPDREVFSGDGATSAESVPRPDPSNTPIADLLAPLDPGDNILTELSTPATGQHGEQ